MGYRTYIAYITKAEHDKIKNLTKEKLYKRYKTKLDDHLGVYDVAKNKLYEFGKYTEFDDEKFYRPVFKNKKLQKKFTSGYDFWIVDKKFLAHIIKHYAERVKTYHDEMISPYFKGRKPSEFMNTVKKNFNDQCEYEYTFDFSKITPEQQTQLFKMIDHIKSMGIEWGSIHSYSPESLPFNLDNGDEVTTSCKYEYSIFELVRIYKTFDWKKNVMIYYGY